MLPKRRRRWLRWLFGTVAFAVLAFVGATALPIWLLGSVAPPTSAFMLLSRIADPATGEPCESVDYEWVPLDAISADLALAVVVAEDQKFFQHEGFDLDSIERAIDERSEGGRVRGASTLTQQVAKNLFLWPARSYVRKGLEFWLTLWLERMWSKRRTLEVYLNVAQFGPCVFGAGAASARYFEVDAASLTPAQAALLATVLPNPRKLRAHNPGPYAQERSRQVQALMEQHRSGPVGHHVRRLGAATPQSDRRSPPPE